MEEQESALAALGYHCRVQGHAAGALWRLTTPEGATATGAAPSDRSARRDAAFAAFILSAMARIRRRGR
jgi:hypothetical protein